MAGGVDKAIITSADEVILKAIGTLHYLTAEQVTQLLYSKTSLTYARERLKRLADAEYLQRTYATKAVPVGRAKTVYRLGSRGIRYLRAAGMPIEERYRPSDHRTHGELFLAHTLAINDVLIAAYLLDAHCSQVRLAGLRHDLDLRRSGQRVEIARNDRTDRITVVPDAWIDLRIFDGDTSRRSPLWIEVDRGTEPVRDFKQKLRAAVTYIESGIYQRVFGTRFVTLDFAVDQSAYREPERAEKRRNEILRWIEEELQALKLPQYGEIIVAGTLPRGYELDPIDFFLSPRWISPFQGLPVSLLDLPEPSS